MAAKRVSFATSKDLDGSTYEDFSEQADEAMYEHITATSGGQNVAHDAIKAALVTSDPIATWRRHDPNRTPHETDSKSTFPLVHIFSQPTGIGPRETVTNTVSMRTWLRIFCENTDLEAARTEALKHAGRIAASIAMDIHCTIITSPSLPGYWLSHYRNVTEDNEPTISEVGLEGTEAAPNVYAVDIEFTWAHRTTFA